MLVPVFIGLQAAAPQPAGPGIYTNEEQVYFEREAGRTPPPWVGVEIIDSAEGLRWRTIDPYGQPLIPTWPYRDNLTALPDGSFADRSVTRYRRARPFTCWVSVRRHADRANGEADWSFDRNLPIHDQGGRVLVQPEGAPPVVIRMRNVIWPAPSTNRPSLVLYVHRPESPDRAESYSWADPDAHMVGINLRWVQASCTRTGG
jgi:hypothetical protein